MAIIIEYTKTHALDFTAESAVETVRLNKVFPEPMDSYDLADHLKSILYDPDVTTITVKRWLGL